VVVVERDCTIGPVGKCVSSADAIRPARIVSERSRTPGETGRGALAQGNGWSVSENAPLQHRFREGISKWWTSVEFQGCPMKLRFVRKNHLCDNGFLRWQKIVTRNVNNLRITRNGCPEKLATWHFFLAVLLRGRWLIPVTTHRRHSRVGFGNQRAQCAMVRNRNPSQASHHDYRDSNKFIARPLHDSFFD
jgi:hypothetical protein